MSKQRFLSETPLASKLTTSKMVMFIDYRNRYWYFWLVLELKNEFGPKLVLIMVGLPARGKSYLAKKLKRYLSWLGYHTRVFNVGDYRRKVSTQSPGSLTHSFQFFDPENQVATEYRDQVS
jgi:hypothetical protein